MDCFNASQNVESDCHRNKLEWALPENKSREFFKDYYNDCKSKYGINRNANIQSDDAFLAKFVYAIRSVPCYAEAHGTFAMNMVFIRRLRVILKVVKDFFCGISEKF